MLEYFPKIKYSTGVVAATAQNATHGVLLGLGSGFRRKLPCLCLLDTKMSTKPSGSFFSRLKQMELDKVFFANYLWARVGDNGYPLV